MMWQIIIASLIVSSISLVAVAVLMVDRAFIDRHLKKLIALASGVLLSSVFVELLPEIFEEADFDPHTFFLVILLGILGFFLVERFIHWHHCHGISCPPEQKVHVAVTNLIGDGIHNFVDGVLMGSAFLVSPEIGIATTIAIVAHEIPQEVSDASVLMFAGFTKKKIIFYNVLFSLTAFAGAILSYFFIGQFEWVIPIFIAIAAGNFIYLALADLIPELHHDNERKSVIVHSLWLMAGVLIFWGISSVVGH